MSSPIAAQLRLLLSVAAAVNFVICVLVPRPTHQISYHCLSYSRLVHRAESTIACWTPSKPTQSNSRSSCLAAARLACVVSHLSSPKAHWRACCTGLLACVWGRWICPSCTGAFLSDCTGSRHLYVFPSAEQRLRSVLQLPPSTLAQELYQAHPYLRA